MGITGKKIAVVGGCGHVGLPLGVKFALAGAQVSLVDISAEAVKSINGGTFPFLENGGDRELQEALRRGLRATTDAKEVANCEVVVFVTGTPVDEHLNPKLSEVLKILDFYQPYFRQDALIVMRSTLFPGTMEHIYNRLRDRNANVRLTFCPERVSQGYALEEIDSLPQIISVFDEPSFDAAYEVFAAIAPKIIRLRPIEAEMTKLMANAWRYLEFAIANQFYMIAEANGVDFHRLYEAIRYEDPRAKGYKAPGFAAGPCLFKDTMQLASFFDNQFYLGHSAMLVNEGLATFAVEKATKELGGSVWGKTIGLLGMAFKPNNDDTRESLSFKVKKVLEFRGAEVVYTDPYVAGGISLDEFRKTCDAVIVCTPHSEYKGLEFTQPVVDVWGFYYKSSLEIFPGALGEEKSAKVANA
ncbi:MAG: nucleotide sugar dehydrogenase [Deltaproteobacteria bacterium]|nr:nucleotide sugar dehydrogenase [Deltaproteobacteria bacterium]